MMMMMLLCAQTRYKKIAEIVTRKNIPKRFGRSAIAPVNAVLVASVGTVAIAALLRGLE